MSLSVTFPQLLRFQDLALFVLRLVVAIVFIASFMARGFGLR